MRLVRIAAVLAAVALATVSGAAQAAALTFTTSDGVVVHGTDYGKGTNAVILVHDKAHSSADWTYFADKLAGNGYHVVTLDLRGHGASKPPETLTDADYPKMVEDVKATAAWLESKGATKIAIVGANLGANLALNAAADDLKVTNVILLSPGLNLSGVTCGAAMDRYGARPILLVAGSDDAYAVKAVNYLDGKAIGEKHVEVLENAGSGVKMMNRDATLEGMVLAWLNGTYFLKAGERKPAAIATGDQTGLTSSGTRFGETPATPAEPAKPLDLGGD
jgi:pimeloyl-ACP methyl ester carboxylesterase